MALGAAIVLPDLLTGSHTLDAAELAEVHREYLEAALHTQPASDIDQADRMIHALWNDAPRLPRLAHGQVKACCVHAVDACRAACCHLDDDNVPVTIAVVRKRDAAPPAGSSIHQNRREVTVVYVGKVTIATVSTNDRRICLIGQAPAERLVALLADDEF